MLTYAIDSKLLHLTVDIPIAESFTSIGVTFLQHIDEKSFTSSMLSHTIHYMFEHVDHFCHNCQ